MPTCSKCNRCEPFSDFENHVLNPDDQMAISRSEYAAVYHSLQFKLAAIQGHRHILDIEIDLIVGALTSITSSTEED